MASGTCSSSLVPPASRLGFHWSFLERQKVGASVCPKAGRGLPQD